MSDPIFPLAVWEEGTLQNDVPANDNALRVEALSRECLGISNSPGATFDGAVYLVGSSPSGAFSSLDPDDITIYRGGTWYAWAPVDGVRVGIGDSTYQFNGSSGWSDIGGGGGSTTVTIVTEAGASTMDPATHSGLNKYVRAGGDVTFDVAEGYSAGEVYNIRATGSVELLVSGVTLTEPAGGTLELTSGMAVSVIMTSSSAGDVIGQTVPV